MAAILIITFILLIIFGPILWVRYVIRKHNNHMAEMPGTGGELAQHLIERFDLSGVTIKVTASNQDYYSPADKIVGLSPEVFHSKSLSAVAIATHEVGHAIQHCRQEKVSRLRGRYSQLAQTSQRLGVFILSISPVLAGVLRAPAIMAISIGAGLLAMFSSVLLHAAILPEEYDASFGKAMPILSEGYVPEQHLPAIRQVLTACALTYVASALADILSIWRWLALVR